MDLVDWLLIQGVGPAAVSIPTAWAAKRTAASALAWVKDVLGRDEATLQALSAAAGAGPFHPVEIDSLRDLLGAESTWKEVASQDVNHLVELIAECLPPSTSRSREDARIAASAIARNLLAFQLSDLDDEQFRNYLIGILERLRNETLNKVDEAFITIHSEVVTAHKQTRPYFGKLFALLRERLPPGPAGPRVLRIYLLGLIDKLDDDLWPTREGSPEAAPRPSDIEQRLFVRAHAGSEPSEQMQNADEVADRSDRLVVLGGPGSGKTWFAKRTARRASERALEQLNTGVDVAQVEVPLYATCQHFFTEGNDVRRALFAAAKRSLPDLGSSKLADAVGTMIDEHQHVLVVLDSLDEAGGVDAGRLNSAADIQGWRLLLTSRLSSWNNQIKMAEEGGSQKVAELQEISYPKDVEAMIAAWLEPEAASRLHQHLANNPARAQAARVPLICALYCIVGSSGDLPDSRRDLYNKATARLLHGRWRENDTWPVDVEAAEQQLRDWASASLADPSVAEGSLSASVTTPITVSGAIDHVCPKVAILDDGRQIERRFIHHTFREHFAAEFVARLSLDDAEQILRPHIWFDSRWENVIPAAIAAHPSGPLLARRLLLPSEELPEVCGQLGRHLAMLATETEPAGWADMDGVILESRLRFDDSFQPRATAWIDHDRQVLERALDLSDNEVQIEVLRALASPPGVERRNMILRTLVAHLESSVSQGLVPTVLDVLVNLEPTGEQLDRTLDVLISYLGSRPDPESAMLLVKSILKLEPKIDQAAQTLDVLVGILDTKPEHQMAREIMRAMPTLGRVGGQRSKALAMLLGLLEAESNWYMAGDLIGTSIELGMSAKHRDQVLRFLMTRLQSEVNGGVARCLGEGVALLEPSEAQRSLTIGLLIGLVESGTNEMVLSGLVCQIVALKPSSAQLERTLIALTARMQNQSNGWLASRLVVGLLEVARVHDVGDRAVEALGARLEAETNLLAATELVAGIVELGQREAQTGRALKALVSLLATNSNSSVTSAVVGGAVELSSLVPSDHQALDALIGLLESEGDQPNLPELVDGALRLRPLDERGDRVVEALVGILVSEAARWLPGTSIGDAAQARQMQDRIAFGEVGMQLPDFSNLAKSLRDGQISDRRHAMISDAFHQLKPFLASLKPSKELLEEIMQAEPSQEFLDAAARLLRSVPEEGSDQAALEEILKREAATGSEPSEALQNWMLKVARPLVFKSEPALGLGQELRRPPGRLGPIGGHKHTLMDAFKSLFQAEPNQQLLTILLDSVLDLGPSKAQRTRVLDALVPLLESVHAGTMIRRLAAGVAELQPSRRQRDHALDLLITRLGTGETAASGVSDLVAGVVELSRLLETDRRRALDVLLDVLDSSPNEQVTSELLHGVIALRPSAQQGSRALAATCAALKAKSTVQVAEELLESALRLPLADAGRQMLSDVLLGLLEAHPDGYITVKLVEGLVELSMLDEQRHYRAMSALAKQLDGATNVASSILTDAATLLSPSSTDLLQLSFKIDSDVCHILAASRRHTDWDTWRTDLPQLARMSSATA